jgi:glycerophosphoryl diester phosphodiesterase
VASVGTISLVLLGLAVAGAPSAPKSAKDGQKMLEVQGHRGARAMRPENTLPAFDYALQVGVDTLELDVLVTKDDHLIVGHDPLLNPDICLGPSGERLPASGVRVRDLTLAELKRYDCGSLKHPRFSEQTPIPKTTMPTLDEVFELVKRSKHPAAAAVKLNIETKSVPGEPELSPGPEAFAALMVDALRKSGLLARCTLQSFDHRTLVAAKRLEPKLVTAALTSDNLLDFVAVAKAIGAGIISPDKQWITAPDVERLHAAGVRVIPWTANTEVDWQRLVDLGVDGIITDDPAKLLRWLGRGP